MSRKLNSDFTIGTSCDGKSREEEMHRRHWRDVKRAEYVWRSYRILKEWGRWFRFKHVFLMGRKGIPGEGDRHHRTYDQFFTYGISSFHTIFRYLSFSGLSFLFLATSPFLFQPMTLFLPSFSYFSLLFLSCTFIPIFFLETCRTRHKGRSGAALYFRKLPGELLPQ